MSSPSGTAFAYQLCLAILHSGTTFGCSGTDIGYAATRDGVQLYSDKRWQLQDLPTWLAGTNSRICYALAAKCPVLTGIGTRLGNGQPEQYRWEYGSRRDAFFPCQYQVSRQPTRMCLWRVGSF
eukprot:1888055-Rhodomonas_salina.1